MHPWRGYPTVSGRPVAPVLLKSIKLIFCTRWHTINIPINSGLDSLLSNHPKSWPNSIVFRRPSSSIRSSDSVRILNEEGIRSRFALHRTSGTLPPKLYGGPGELQRSHTEMLSKQRSPIWSLQTKCSHRSTLESLYHKVCDTQLDVQRNRVAFPSLPVSSLDAQCVLFTFKGDIFWNDRERDWNSYAHLCEKEKQTRFSLLSQNFWSF